MIWSMKEEAMELILRTHTLKGNISVLTNNSGDVIRRIGLHGDVARFRYEQNTSAPALKTWQFYVETSMPPDGWQLHINLSGVVSDAYAAGNDEDSVAHTINCLADAITQAVQFKPEFFDCVEKRRRENPGIYLRVSAPTNSEWTRLKSLITAGNIL